MDPSTPSEQAPQRCGLVAIVGRPNVGKSTLLNALVGQKVSITSRKAQTTRHRITGIRTVGAAQFVFVDTPGFQTRHSTALNRNLNRTVQGVLGDVDVVLFLVEAGRFGLDDAKVLALMPPDKPVLLVANKLDNVHRRAELAPWLQSMQDRHPFAEMLGVGGLLNRRSGGAEHRSPPTDDGRSPRSGHGHRPPRRDRAGRRLHRQRAAGILRKRRISASILPRRDICLGGQPRSAVGIYSGREIGSSLPTPRRFLTAGNQR